MSTPRVVIIGGGLAGLTAGCHARTNGLGVTIIEHNLALGGVCTAWRRGPYLVDGCIHWLTGGPFTALYEELGLVPAVPLRPLQEFSTYRHVREGWEVSVSHDLEKTEAALRALAPEDADALRQLFGAIDRVVELEPPVDRPPELASLRDRLLGLWEMRHAVGPIMRFRQPLGEWATEHLKSPRVRRVLLHTMPAETPTLFLQFVLGYLARGWLSRPIGGTERFRDALISRYHALGGEAILNTTVEEVLVSRDRAVGVRLTDGTLIDADVVVSTSSAPETVFRLLAGRYGASLWKTRMDRWQMFQPIVLASFGVARSFADQPSTLILDGLDPLDVGGHPNEHVVLRIYNEDPAFAPPGHTVVQAMLSTQYDWWATRGAHYLQEKDRVADRVLACLDRHLPGMQAGVQMIDVATPLTFWRSARSWRGAFEGWMPTAANAFRHVPKTLPGLDGFYLAGQWVEPGGGVPAAVMSGRHVAEIVCEALDRRFAVPTPAARPPA